MANSMDDKILHDIASAITKIEMTLDMVEKDALQDISKKELYLNSSKESINFLKLLLLNKETINGNQV